jgi:hypothetical protein
VVGSVHLYGLGQRLTPAVDYTISGVGITIIQAGASYPTGSLLSDYRI